MLRGPKLAAVVSAAKRIKRVGPEPTYAAIVAACPSATRNPETQQPVDKARVYTALRDECHDGDPTDTWQHISRLSRSVLTSEAKEKRLAFAKHMSGLKHTQKWYRDKAAEMTLARKGGKGWMSVGARKHWQNLRIPKSVLKMNSSDTTKAWWIPVLARGRLHVEPAPDDFPGETEPGAEVMAGRVRAALTARFRGKSSPRTVFTDRGIGFYQPSSGHITEGYRQALRTHGLKAFFPRDASVQPGQLQDLMLHETAVSWMRARLTQTLPTKPWEETLEQYRARLKACAAHINASHDVAGLCRELPQRLATLRDCAGDRLAK